MNILLVEGEILVDIWLHLEGDLMESLLGLTKIYLI